MIPFNFIYCRPESLKEVADIFCRLKDEGKNPLYYGGGSEIITMSRAGAIHPGAVIDIKNIPECTILNIDNDWLNIGACCTLNQVKESKLFPLLGLAIGRIADHTNQCRTTLGGNLCGTIIYRESSLPLLLSDAEITFNGKSGLRTEALETVFNKKIQMNPDEFIVNIHVPKWSLNAKHFHIKRTRNEKIDYPLVSVAAIIKDNYLRTAFSGICSYPFRSKQIEAILNDKSKPCSERVHKAAELLPEPPHSDGEGSGEYRLFVFKNTLQALLEEWENGKV